MSGLLFPKPTTKKKKKKHSKSILQDKQDKRCYLCMELEDDYTQKIVQEHHAIYGTANRAKSEEWGLMVNLCHRHHQDSKEGVHHNVENKDILRRLAQERFEERHGHEKFMKEFGYNKLDIHPKG